MSVTENLAYTISEVSKLTGLSAQTVTRLFENEPGVLIVASQGAKRAYRTIRIPQGVYHRVIKKISVK